MKCAECREQLSLYLDGIMTEEERRLIEEHLLLCEHCGIYLAELKQTREMLRNLEEVEPPPWFTQKIMNRIRGEAEPKKTFLRRFFYPLHIKLPMEALATCLVVVLALFLYRHTGPEIKAIHEPDQTVIVSPDTQAKKSDKGPLSPAKEKDSQPDTMPPLPAPSAGISSEKASPAPAAPSTGAGLAGKDLQETETRYEAQEQKLAAAPAQRPAAAAPPAKLKEERIPSPAGPATADVQEAGKSRSSAPMRKAVSLGDKRQFFLTVSTDSLETTVKATTDLLNRLSARNANRSSRQPHSVVLTADLPGERVREFLDELKKLGPVKEKEAPDSRQNEYVTVTIEITAGP